jgi:hypothetical protein
MQAVLEAAIRRALVPAQTQVRWRDLGWSESVLRHCFCHQRCFFCSSRGTEVRFEPKQWKKNPLLVLPVPCQQA